MDVQHALESHPSINGMCDYVGISRSGYYQREKRHNHQSPRKLRKKFIQGEIKAIWIKSLCIYGAGKITQELRSKGYKIAERTVGKYMRELGIHAVYLTPWTTTTRKRRGEPPPLRKWCNGSRGSFVIQKEFIDFMCNKLTSIDLQQQYNVKARRNQLHPLITVRNSEIIQRGFKSILGCKACIKKIAVLLVPLRESAIVERLHIIRNDKRNNVISKAFFEHDQPADTPIAVLEWMNALKANMVINNVFKGM